MPSKNVAVACPAYKLAVDLKSEAGRSRPVPVSAPAAETSGSPPSRTSLDNLAASPQVPGPGATIGHCRRGPSVSALRCTPPAAPHAQSQGAQTSVRRDPACPLPLLESLPPPPASAHREPVGASVLRDTSQLKTLD